MTRLFWAKWILITAAAINAALVSFGFFAQWTWKPIPSNARLSSATWHASQTLGGLAYIMCIPLIILAVAASVAWRHQQTAAHRELSHCRSCGYDRRSLSTSVPCPECGTPPR